MSSQNCIAEVWTLNPCLLGLAKRKQSGKSKSGHGSKCVLFSAVFVFSLGTESRESGYESGILVSKAVDLEVNGTKLKPAGEHLHFHESCFLFASIHLHFFK